MGDVVPIRPDVIVPVDQKMPEAHNAHIDVDEELSRRLAQEERIRREELNRLLDEDEDTPFRDPWPDHLYK